MLYWAVVLLLVGFVAGIFGFGGIASTAFGIAKGLVLLKVIAVILLVVGVIALFNHFSRGGGKLLP